MTATAENVKEIPLEACRFDASVEFPSAGAGKTKPVKILARGPGAVTNWYFGPIVHDMAGMQLDGDTIPIDYCHLSTEVLGFGDQFEAGKSGLTILGQIVPYVDGDRASEVIFKSAAGVPYQGSIFFDPFRLVLESVGAGMTAEVNGQTIEGPVLIARKWVLRGVAICPYGTDWSSATEFSRRTGAKPTTYFEANPTLEHAMKTAKSGETETQNTEPTAEQKAAQEPAKLAADQATAPAKLAADTKAANDAAAAAAAGQQAAPAPGKKYLDAFGDVGGVWFAQGVCFEDAQGKFNALNVDKVKKLETENATLKTQLGALRGEKDPVTFQAEQSPEEKRAAELAAGGPIDNFTKFAAGLQMPGK
jgi:hypothetical protein